MEIIVLSSKAEIEEFIKEHEKCVIKFSAEWCAPCRRMAQYFQAGLYLCFFANPLFLKHQRPEVTSRPM